MPSNKSTKFIISTNTNDCCDARTQHTHTPIKSRLICNSNRRLIFNAMNVNLCNACQLLTDWLARPSGTRCELKCTCSARVNNRLNPKSCLLKTSCLFLLRTQRWIGSDTTISLVSMDACAIVQSWRLSMMPPPPPPSPPNDSICYDNFTSIECASTDSVFVVPLSCFIRTHVFVLVFISFALIATLAYFQFCTGCAVCQGIVRDLTIEV